MADERVGLLANKDSASIGAYKKARKRLTPSFSSIPYMNGTANTISNGITVNFNNSEAGSVDFIGQSPSRSNTPRGRLENGIPPGYGSTHGRQGDDGDIPVTVEAPSPIHSKHLLDKIKIYKRRWFILFVYFLLPVNHGWVWATWGPLTDSTEIAFGWDDDVTAMMTNWGPITFIVSLAPMVWLMDVKGLRWSVLISAALTTAGTGIRCFTVTPPLCTILIHIGQALNGIAGPVAMAAITLVSAAWFPPDQRTTSTAIGATGGGFGLGLAFFLTPLLVPPVYNGTDSFNSSTFEFDQQNVTEIVMTTRENIRTYMYVAFGVNAASFLVVLIYFPKVPPLPPCKSASVERVDFKGGVKRLARNAQFWLIAITFGISTGVLEGWSAVLPVNLQPLDISQDDADWMGCYSTIAGQFAGLIISRFADVFRRRMKVLLLVVYGSLFAVFLWLALMIAKIIYHSYTLVYVAVVLTNLFWASGYPLFFEFACEMTFPVAEGITSGVLALSNNIATLLLLLTMSIHGIDERVANWVGVGALVSSLPILLLMREQYSRLDVDDITVSIEPVEKSTPGPDSLVSSLATDSTKM